MHNKRSLLGYAALVGIGLLAPSSASSVDVVNQRDVGYQQSVSRLVEASQSLDRALALVRESQAGTPLANVDYRRLLGDLTAIRREMELVVTHHSTRSETYRPIVPDASYIVPPPGSNKRAN